MYIRNVKGREKGSLVNPIYRGTHSYTFALTPVSRAALRLAPQI